MTTFSPGNFVQTDLTMLSDGPFIFAYELDHMSVI